MVLHSTFSIFSVENVRLMKMRSTISFVLFLGDERSFDEWVLLLVFKMGNLKEIVTGVKDIKIFVFLSI